MLIRLLLGRRPITIIPSSRRVAFSTTATSTSAPPSPLVDFFRSYGVEEEQTHVMVDKYPKLRSVNVETILRSKLDFLRSAGVSGTDIPRILVANPFIFAMFGSAFIAKVHLFGKFGWSEEQVVELIRKHPFSMTMEDESLAKVLNFFSERVGWGGDFLSLNPDLICLNLERRVMPRCSVINILMTKGLLQRDVDRLLPTTLRFRHKRFFKIFVRRYLKEAPETKAAFRRQIPFQGWEWLKKGA